jgi:O-acetylserine/cysteine efflux transporter
MSRMSPKDLMLALVVVFAWGINFVVIKIGLHGVPPMLLGALRFIVVAVPAAFFVKRPQVPWHSLFAYAITISFGQFAFLFSAIYVGMPAGLASLVLQAQAFFTLIFARCLLRERLRARNILGLVVAAAGLTIIALQGGQTITPAGFALTLCAAASWGLGNIFAKKVGQVDLVGFIVWAALIPPLPFLALSYWLEGPERMLAALSGIGLSSIFAIIYLAFVATLLGYGLWSRLLSRHPVSEIAPFSLLVPIVGLASASLLLHESLSTMDIAGAVLIMTGLAASVLGVRVVSLLKIERSQR